MKKFTILNILIFTISILTFCIITQIPSAHAENSPRTSVSIITQSPQDSVIIEDAKSTEIISGNSITIQNGMPSIYITENKSPQEQNPQPQPQPTPAPLTQSVPTPTSITNLFSNISELASFARYLTVTITSLTLPPAGNNWLFYSLMVNIIMLFLGAYLRLYFGNSPGRGLFTS